jgi:hypothetical protein
MGTGMFNQLSNRLDFPVLFKIENTILTQMILQIHSQTMVTVLIGSDNQRNRRSIRCGLCVGIPAPEPPLRDLPL